MAGTRVLGIGAVVLASATTALGLVWLNGSSLAEANCVIDNCALPIALYLLIPGGSAFVAVGLMSRHEGALPRKFWAIIGFSVTLTATIVNVAAQVSEVGEARTSDDLKGLAGALGISLVVGPVVAVVVLWIAFSIWAHRDRRGGTAPRDFESTSVTHAGRDE
jgi:hypothetical protein